MRVYSVDSVKELAKLSKTLRRKGLFSFLNTSDTVVNSGIKIKGSESENNKFDWLNQNYNINFDGKTYRMRVPTAVGKLIHYIRPIYESIGNDGFLDFQKVRTGYANEVESLQKLEGKVNTLVAPKELNGLTKAIVTELKPDNKPLVDLIYKARDSGDTSTILDYVSKQFTDLKTMNDNDVIWSDANPINVEVDENNDLHYKGFSFKPNPEMSEAQKQVKNFLNLYYTNIHRSSLSPDLIASVAVNAYHPGEDISTELKKASLKIRKPNIQNTAVWGLNASQITDARKKLNDYLRSYKSK